jgi:replicative DNA helicase
VNIGSRTDYVTFATIAERLGRRTQSIGGVQVLHEMMSDAPTGAYIDSLVKVLAQTAAPA